MADSTKPVTPGAGVTREQAEVAFREQYPATSRQMLDEERRGHTSRMFCADQMEDAFVSGYIRGQRSRDAEMERLQRELAEAKASIDAHVTNFETRLRSAVECSRFYIADEQLADDWETVLANLKFEDSRSADCAESVARITAALARCGK